MLNFLDDYWMQNTISANKHFYSLNTLLINSVYSTGIPEDTLTTMYKGKKKWDMHFPSKKIAIEYKTIASETKINNGNLKKSCNYLNLRKNVGHRIEEAIGAAIDLKHKKPDYKLGYLLVFTHAKEKNTIPPFNIIETVIDKFDKMINNGVYDFFCPLITFGIENHAELSEKHSFQNFIQYIKNTKEKEISPLQQFFV